MTHFANADTDDPDDPQLDDARAARAVRRGRSRGASPPARRCACATPRTARARCCFPRRGSIWCAPGIALYGNGRWPDGAASHARRCGSSPRSRSCARSPRARRSATARLWRAERDEPGRGPAVSATPTACRAARAVTREVAIRGKRVPLVGRISMDIAIADVTDVPDVAVGDAAVLLGRASGGVVDHRAPSTARGPGCPSTKSRAA